MSSKNIQIIAAGLLLLIPVAIVGFKISYSGVQRTLAAETSKTPDLKSSPFGLTPTNPDDVQVDNQNNSIEVVTYRGDLSQSVAVFDVDIKSDAVDLTKFNYKKNLVLADTDIKPLQSKDMIPVKISTKEIQIRFVSEKFAGTHFHFLIENLDGISDRVVHFYRTI